MSYPKIETLFKRDEKFNITDEIRCPEFDNIKKWLITEKIDGTNIRIIYTPDDKLLIRGKTDRASIPTFLLEELQGMFRMEKFKEIFPDVKEVCLYGEGYGSKIQKGGGNYNKSNSFRLFDIWIDGWWLEWDSVEEIAKQLEIKTAPVIMKDGTIKNAISLVKNEHLSDVAMQEGTYDTIIEGIVARAYPMLLFRNGIPVKFKLKCKDYIKK